LNAFKTRKGRTVYDGGGIQPDVEMEETNLVQLRMLCFASWDQYASYYYKNPNLGINVISDADCPISNGS
jgi:carboxyl-terminal processing protease